MQSSDKSKLPSNPFFRVLMILFAITVMPVYEYGKKVSGQAYKGIMRGLFNMVVALPLSFGGAFMTAKYLGWNLGYSLLLWIPASILAFLLVLFVVWPSLYLFLFKPLFDLFEWIFKQTEKLAEKQVKDLVSGLVGLLKVLPGSGYTWNFVEDDKQGYRWVKAVATFLAGASIIGLSAYIAFTTYNLALPYVTFSIPYLTPALAGVAAFVPTILVGGILLQFLAKNELHFSACTLTAVGVYSAAPLTAKAVVAFGLPAAAIYGANPLLFLVGLAYVYPTVHAILKSGLFAKLLEGLKWLIEETYDDDNDVFKKFFSHSVNIAASLAIGALIVVGAGVYGFIPAYVVYTVAALVVLSTYISLGHFLEDAPGNVLVGLASAAYSGWWFHGAFSASLTGVTLWTLLGATVLAAFFVAVPVVYIALRFLSTPWLSKPLGSLLDTVHDHTYKLARKVSRWWDKNVIQKTYDDSTEYAKLFVHVANLAILALGVWQALPIATGVLGLPIWATAVGLTILGYLTYLILGKIFLGIGPAFLGFALGIIGGFAAGYQLYEVASGWIYTPVAILIGGTVFSVLTWVVFPLIYMVVKVPANPILTPWLKPLLEGVYDFFWNSFEGIWSKFVTVYMMVHNAVFKPVVVFFASLVAAAKLWWDEFRGKSKG